MRKIIFTLICFICQINISHAQKCLVIFGINEDITEKHLDKVQLALYFNDSIQVPYKVIRADVESSTYMFEFDFRPGKYTLRADKEGYTEVQKDFTVTTKRNTTLGIGTLG